MAKVQVCDKCGAEIKRSSLFDDSFGADSDFEQDYDSIDTALEEAAEDFLPQRKRITYPELCSNCSPKFDALVDKFNKEIKNFLKEK